MSHPTLKPLDDRWIEPVKDIASAVNELGRFAAALKPVQAERELFFQGEVENPRFSYRHDCLCDSAIPRRIKRITADIQNSDSFAVVIDLYERKLAHQALRHQMVCATAAGDDQLFAETSAALYGKPKKHFFAYVARQVAALCQQQEDRFPEAARRLHKVVGKINAAQLDMSAEVLPEVVTTSPIVTSGAEVKAIFNEVITRHGIPGVTFVEKENDESHFTIYPERREVHVPHEGNLQHRPRPLTVVGVKALAEHEIGVHLRRAVEGAAQPLRLLEIGLDGYVAGEEGLASYVQQQIEGATEFYGMDRYLAIGLALGSDGIPRDFRAVFSLMTDYYTLVMQPQPGSSAAATAAWNVALRVFRGTSGTTPGVAYTKDLVYLEGNVGIWHLLVERPHVFEQLFVGKFNPLLTHHIKSLETLGILKEW